MPCLGMAYIAGLSQGKRRGELLRLPEHGEGHVTCFKLPHNTLTIGEEKGPKTKIKTKTETKVQKRGIEPLAMICQP